MSSPIGRTVYPQLRFQDFLVCSDYAKLKGRMFFSDLRSSRGQHDQKSEAAENSTSKHVTRNTRLPAYMDNAATTIMDPRVLDAMLPYLTCKFGNPHSRSHVYGWEAHDAVELAREQVSRLINCSPKEIIFTSGATESNNIAVKGLAQYIEGNVKDARRHIVTSQIEHKCILSCCRALQEKHWDVTYLPVKTDGLIDMDALDDVVNENTALVSVMMVNNEIGVLQPVTEIGKLCKKRNVLFHTDAAQAVGKIPVDVENMKIDMLSISGHKLYGPKGIGVLYVRKKSPRVRLRALMDGGGQERGIRSGTLPLPLVVGMGAACELALKEMDRDNEHVKEMSEILKKRIYDKLTRVTLNGSEEKRYCGNVNLSFSCVEGESLLMSLADTLSVSSGSACTSASLEPSYVLRAIGVGDDLAHTSIRFGIGRFTTISEINLAVDEVIDKVIKLRGMSPLWEMVEAGDYDKVVWS